MSSSSEYDGLRTKLDYLQSRVKDLSSSDESVYHQMNFLHEEMDVIRRRMLEIDTYDFYKQLGDRES